VVHRRVNGGQGERKGRLGRRKGRIAEFSLRTPFAAFAFVVDLGGG
jgi:hypothetical protein